MLCFIFKDFKLAQANLQTLHTNTQEQIKQMNQT